VAGTELLDVRPTRKRLDAGSETRMVVVTKAQLSGNCGAHLNSPEWDAEQEALVYQNWDATVTRLLSSRRGTVHLEWLVVRSLVPMTVDQFLEARKARWGL
jgi:hypothetical protein